MKIMDKIVDGYFAYVDWLGKHKHVAGWAIFILAVVALVF